MLRTGIQFGTVRGEDRFYTPVKARRNNQNQQKQGRRSKNNESPDSSSTKSSKSMASDDRTSNSDEAKEPSEPSITPSSNLERFLESTTPFVTAQYFSKVAFSSSFFPFVSLSSLRLCVCVCFIYFDFFFLLLRICWKTDKSKL